MRISFFFFILAICTIAIVTADFGIKKGDARLPVHTPEEEDDKSPADINVLLSTLFEMHHNLIAQISLLQDKLETPLPTTKEKTEIKHMVAHYTAQKNNIESSIHQIQSNEGLLMAEGRNIEEDSPTQTKSISYLVNLFKRNRAPSTEQTNPNVGYAFQYTKPHEQPPRPTFAFQSSPSISQPSYEPQPTYVFQSSQPQPTSQPSQPLPTYVFQSSQPTATSQHHYEPPSPTYVYQAPQNDLVESIFPGFDAQANQNGQFYSSADITQPQNQPQPQAQFEFETVFRPQNLPVRGPQVPELDTQRYQQQKPFGQKEGVFIYYPNGMITDDKNRPSTANRLGQVFDRFGQVFSNFGNRQPTNNGPTNENEIVLIQRSDDLSKKNKVKGSQSKTSSKQKDMSDEEKKEEIKSNLESEKKQEKEAMPS